MKLQLRSLFSLMLWLTLPVVVVAQQTDSLVVNTNGEKLEVEPGDDQTFAYVSEDTVQVSPKKVKVKRDTINYPLISALSIYFDYPKLFSFFTEFENKAEVGLQLQLFKHVLLRTELGRGRIQPTNFYKNANYEVSGNYARVGIAYTKNLGAKSRLNLGVNYGSSFFNDKGRIQIESPSQLFTSFEEPFERKALRGDWFEVTFGTESHMGKNLYLGFIGRLRILNSYDTFEELDVFAIPGYGRTFDKSIPALNLYIKYRIQFY